MVIMVVKRNQKNKGRGRSEWWIKSVTEKEKSKKERKKGVDEEGGSIHTRMHTYINSMHAYLHTYIHKLHTYNHHSTYIAIYISLYTCLYTQIRTYIHI